MLNSILEVSKYLLPALLAVLGTTLTYRAKSKKDQSDASLAYRQQLIDQYNQLVLRVDNLERDNQQKALTILEQKNKLYRLENKLEEEFNYIAVIQGYYSHIPRPAWLKAPDGVMYYINDAFEDEFGVSKLAYEGQIDSNIWSDSVAKQFAEDDDKVLASKKGIEVVQYIPTCPGSSLFNPYKVLLFPVMYKTQLIGVGGIVCNKIEEIEDGD